MGVRPLNILVTGAGGFVGRHVTTVAALRGHRVRRLVRSGEGEVVLDLAAADRATLDDAVEGVDVVVHAAASLSGDACHQDRDTRTATRRLLEALSRRNRLPLLVLISSISVLSAGPDLEGRLIDEDTPLEPRPETRDAYAAAKLDQEVMARAVAARRGLPLTILRPGAVYGPGHCWNAHLGAVLGPVLLRLGRDGEIPLTHIENCADAVLLAAESRETGTFNLVDDDLPDRSRFLAALAPVGWPRLVLPIDWRLMLAAAQLLAPLPVAKPGLLRPAVLRARMMPVRYSNARAKAALGWVPRIGFDEGMARLLAEKRA